MIRYTPYHAAVLLFGSVTTSDGYSTLDNRCMKDKPLHTKNFCEHVTNIRSLPV